jgi:hypothetical protein
MVYITNSYKFILKKNTFRSPFTLAHISNSQAHIKHTCLQVFLWNTSKYNENLQPNFEKEAKFGQIYTHEPEDDIYFTCLKCS